MSQYDTPLTGRRIPASEVIAALACLAASAGFLVLASNLPESVSTGDVGPGALPRQVGVFGLICSLAYLVMTLRKAFPAQPSRFAGVLYALASFLIGVVAVVAVPWLSLAVSLALCSGMQTLLFPGRHRWLRAGATALGMWLIATLLFQRLLGLPLP
ncbi:MAG: tripartite tricarboxylate transporter TctB family protein [Paracoccus sp. (in: a-proteobacteria)]|uniref:tripartite tricarboxylate transporter TctB family protein n=1 Tax=Paracoccus sp. TaxID=267 RepID=UPI0026DF7D59|nr:tripartite tricarboxylate transporter TctB family protein [Paracoccus sp. (in: a-proteobacteria)]MDO5613881.1 tripartite tricarboxylate transporter TctB family protein [Paracoccus sp. (in: a-proteobacteria)]